jgi:hypothetical protein
LPHLRVEERDVDRGLGDGPVQHLPEVTAATVSSIPPPSVLGRSEAATRPEPLYPSRAALCRGTNLRLCPVPTIRRADLQRRSDVGPVSAPGWS